MQGWFEWNCQARPNNDLNKREHDGYRIYECRQTLLWDNISEECFYVYKSICYKGNE